AGSLIRHPTGAPRRYTVPFTDPTQTNARGAIGVFTHFTFRERTMRTIRFAVLAAAAGMFPGMAAHAVTLSSPVADGAIVLDGSRDDWAGLERYPDDGNEGYPIDIGFVTLAHD